MQLRAFVLRSIAALILLSVSGCYTVFRTQTLDGRIPAGVSERELDESSSDMAFDTYEHERWRFYLSCPWWYQSIWCESDYYDDGYQGDEVTLEEAPPAYSPPIDGIGIPSPPPAYAPPVYAPVAPATGTDVKYKSEESNPDPPEKDSKPKPPHKPSRRTNGGDQ